LKVIKPLRLGFFSRTFEHRRQHHWVASLMACFPFPDPEELIPEVDMWQALGGEIGRFGMFDIGMWKERGEVIAISYAYPAGGRAAPHCQVRLRIGPIDKQLYVFGDRVWKATGPTEPQPFEKMAITYASAFGGPEFEVNPVGRGAATIDQRGEKVQPLPNVEDPGNVVMSPRDRPRPASFAAEDFALPYRFKKMGTYDEAWRRDRFPGLADDIDWSVFNLAPRDQQIEGYWNGEEELELYNLHPDEPRLASRLPRVTARCLVSRFPPGTKPSTDYVPSELEDLEMRRDTVLLVPHREMGVVIFRGVTRIDSNDAYEVAHAIAAFEDAAEPPRPKEHYLEALRARLDPKRQHLFVLRDRDLLPATASPTMPTDASHEDPLMEVAESENILYRRQRDRLRRELDAMKERFRARGFDADVLEAPVLPPPEQLSLDDMADRIEQMEKERAQFQERLDRERAKRDELLKAECKATGADFEAARQKYERPPAEPPTFRAAQQLEQLADLAAIARRGGEPNLELERKLADPRYKQQLEETETRLHELYRSSAHHYGPAELRPADRIQLARQHALIAIDAGEPLERFDLTGVDLAGADLTGADLRGALLEGANLRGVDLTGAKLDGAVLTRAVLDMANLSRASLRRANLGGASLCDATIEEADLSEAVIDGADLSRASLARSTLSLALIGEVKVAATSFARVKGDRVFFSKTDLRGAAFEQAELEQCGFVSCDLREVRFDGAKLVSCTFVTVRGGGALFAGAIMDNVRMVKDCDFEDADFSRAAISGSCFRGARLSGSIFVAAQARECDFGEAELCQANLERLDAARSYFIRADLGGARLAEANLLQALFHHAVLRRADFRGANLFGADLSYAVGDELTRFTDANVGRVVGLERR
jgi:uncharacterized protein YjbI with pentapeptide repeats